MFFRTCLWVAGLLWSCAPSAAWPGLRPDRVRAIEHVIEAERLRLKIPGLTVSIGEDLRLAWTKGFGVADLENQVPASPATMYRIGSISKPITAVAILQLAERGKLDLDAPIQKYVPLFPQKPWPITARELLGHLGGIRHYRTIDEMNSTRHYTNLTDPLRAFANEPLLFPPGTRYSYSTYGYNLLGVALEAASHTRFLDYLKENVFAPAGMARIRQDDVFAIVPHRSHGYVRRIDGTLQNCALADTSNKIPGGGFISTADDLVRFVIALDRGALVSRETRLRMFTPQRTSDGKAVPYGLGWSIFEHGSRRWVGHAGAQQGVSTYLLAAPEEGLVVAVMANLEEVNLQGLATRIADLVVEPGN